MKSLSVSSAARWVTHPAWVDPPAMLTQTPVLRRRFRTDEQPTAGRLCIAGLGVWTATLDGVAVSEDVLEPGTTDFRRRVAVTAIDLTGRLGPGPHELVVQLGEGSAHVREPVGRYTKFVGTCFAPRMLGQLTWTSSSGVETVIVTDGTWEAALGKTTFTHWYGGEDYDARLTLADWVSVHVLEGESAGPELWQREAPPVRVVDTFLAIERRRLDNVSLLLDFGVNHAGRPLLAVGQNVPAGTTVELWPAENLDQTGHVDQTSTGKPIFDTFTAAGSEATWHPAFCYHGYRYLEVRCNHGEALDGVSVTSQQLRSDNLRVGTFDSSDDTLNRIYELTDRAVQSNLFSVLTDCPHREKLGWLEQLHLVFPTLAHYYDVRPQLSDMVTHMMDAQTAEGLVPDIAPELTVFGGGFRDDVNWGSAIVQLPAQLWRCYGDLGPARRAWPAIERYLGYVADQLVDGLLPGGLSDWKSLDPSTPATLVHGHGHLQMLWAAADLAVALGLDPERYRTQADDVRARLELEHVHEDGRVGSGSQASYALALDAQLVPTRLVSESLAWLYAQIAADDSLFTVGEIGLPAVFRVLTAAGRHDLLLELVTNDRGPGYANMIHSGCTALAETWEVIQGEASANHFMLGYVVTWLTECIAGLRQAPASVDWRHVVVEPQAVGLLDHASVAYTSPAGHYVVSWRWDLHHQRVWLEITVPDDGSAELRCPAGFVAPTSVGLVGPGFHRVELAPVL